MPQKPSDSAEVTITDKRFVRSNIKLIGEETNDNRTKDTQGCRSKQERLVNRMYRHKTLYLKIKLDYLKLLRRSWS